MNPFGEGVGQIDEAEHEGELQRRVEVEVDVLQHERAEQADHSSDACVTNNTSEELKVYLYVAPIDPKIKATSRSTLSNNLIHRPVSKKQVMDCDHKILDSMSYLSRIQSLKLWWLLNW